MAQEAVVWAIPVIVIYAIYFAPRHVISAGTVLTGVVALGLLALAAKRPDRALLGLIIFLPFQGFVLARLYGWGLPASVTSHLGAWKETLALGVIVAGARNFLATGRRADGLDRVALGFILLVALYALLQPDIVPGAPSARNIRLLGFRELAGFPLLLLGARHAPLGPRFPERAARAVFATGAVVAAIGIYEAIFSSAWNTFVVRTVGYTRYQQSVLHAAVSNPYDIRIYGNVGSIKFVRIGSVFLNALNLAFYLVLPFAIGFERILRRSATTLSMLATVAIGAAILLTQTRSAMVAALVIAFLALQPTAGRRRHWRTQAALVLAALAIVAVPGTFATGAARRIGAANTSADQSSAGHLSALTAGSRTVANHPLGLGLGTSAGIGQRFGSGIVAENNYLTIGIQLGVVGMLIFIALTLTLILKLRRATRASPELLVTAAWAAGIGLAVAALDLQPWLDFGVTWSYWASAGAALGAASVRAAAAARARQRPRVPAQWVPQPVSPSANR